MFLALYAFPIKLCAHTSPHMHSASFARCMMNKVKTDLKDIDIDMSPIRFVHINVNRISAKEWITRIDIQDRSGNFDTDFTSSSAHDIVDEIVTTITALCSESGRWEWSALLCPSVANNRDSDEFG